MIRVIFRRIMHREYVHVGSGINTDLSLLILQKEEIRHVQIHYCTISVYTLEILGRENQPQKWEIPCSPPSK